MDIDEVSFEQIKGLNLEELFIISQATVTHEGAKAAAGSPENLVAGLSVEKTNNHKCGRCWRLLPEVESDGSLCARCAEVVK